MNPSLDRIAWIAFLTLLPLLWVSGVHLFARSALPTAKKIAWSSLLVALGVVVGGLLPLPGIRNKFGLLLLGLPFLAAIDVQLAKSQRTFLFWFRACAFEICTVFGVAGLVRYLLELR
jgi:hypothetical protein